MPNNNAVFLVLPTKPITHQLLISASCELQLLKITVAKIDNWWCVIYSTMWGYPAIIFPCSIQCMQCVGRLGAAHMIMKVITT